MQTVRVASWNIAAARTNKSLSLFDYNKENINYFIKTISDTNADIICLQEVHFGTNKDMAKEIAEALNYPYYYTHACHESHIDSNLKLSNSIISNIEPIKVESYKLPYPKFDLLWPDGRPAKKYVKELQHAEFSNFNIYNTQLIPLGLFGVLYGSKKAKLYTHDLEQKLIKHIKDPLIFCGDFSGDFPDDKTELIFKLLFNTYNIKDAIPHKSTRPKKDNLVHQNDHIYFSPDFSLKKSRIIPTKSDHYLCTTDFNFKHTL